MDACLISIVAFFGFLGPLIGKQAEPFAWNRTDKYVAPDFEGYFPKNDQAAAERLNEFISDSQLREQSPDEYIEAVRCGLRSTKHHKTNILGTFGNHFIWNKKEQNEKAIELMYHASLAPEGVGHYAMYHGPTVVVDRSDNLMRMMVVNHHAFDWDIQRRIHWSFKTHGDKEKTLRQLEQLLDDHKAIGDDATIVAYEFFVELAGTEPPRMERFAGLGKWVVGFSHRDVLSQQKDGDAELRSMFGQHLDISPEKVVDYVARIDGDKWVGVMLADGLSQKNEILKTLKNEDGFAVEFTEQLNEQLFRSRRLGEFGKHVDGKANNSLPAYTLPDPGKVYAWNNPQKYVAPDYFGYFPDDELAGKELDQLYLNRKDISVTDRKLLDTFRQGLRHSTIRKNVLFGYLSSALGWPADPMQTEIMYHASSLDAPKNIRNNAIYFGLGNGWDKSENVLRLFADIVCTPTDRTTRHNTNRRIVWSMRNKPNELDSFIGHLERHLLKHAEMDDATLQYVVSIYHDLTKADPPNVHEFNQRGLFLVLWSRSECTNVQDYEDYIATIQLPDNVPAENVSLKPHKDKDEIYAIGIVRGFDANKWLVDEIVRDPGNSIHGALPWPGEWGKEALPTFEDFKDLQEDRPNK